MILFYQLMKIMICKFQQFHKDYSLNHIVIWKVIYEFDSCYMNKMLSICTIFARILIDSKLDILCYELIAQYMLMDNYNNDHILAVISLSMINKHYQLTLQLTILMKIILPISYHKMYPNHTNICHNLSILNKILI